MGHLICCQEATKCPAHSVVFWRSDFTHRGNRVSACAEHTDWLMDKLAEYAKRYRTTERPKGRITL